MAEKQQLGPALPHRQAEDSLPRAERSHGADHPFESIPYGDRFRLCLWCSSPSTHLTDNASSNPTARSQKLWLRSHFFCTSNRVRTRNPTSRASVASLRRWIRTWTTLSARIQDPPVHSVQAVARLLRQTKPLEKFPIAFLLAHPLWNPGSRKTTRGIICLIRWYTVSAIS